MTRQCGPVFLARALFSVLLCIAGASGALHAAPLPGQIIPDTSHPEWLKRQDGRPFFLCGPGDPENFLYRGSRNSDGTRNGDQDDLIDKISGTGANSIYMEAIRTFGDGPADHNPFIGSDFTNNLDDDILDQWETWFTEMDDNGVVIYFFFYDDAIRISTEIGWPLDGNGELHPQEQYFIETLVNRFEHHENLVWVPSEEAQEMGPDWIEHTEKIVAAIKNADDHDHVIGVHKLTGVNFSEFADNPDIDQFLMQDNATPSATLIHNKMVNAWDIAAGRYNLNMSEVRGHGTGDTARKKNWAAALGGAYVMAKDWDIDTTPLLTLQQCGYLANFMESTRFYEMAPNDNLRHGGTDYVLAEPGTSYIAYAWDLVGDIGVESMSAGDYDFTWIDAQTGNTVNQFGISVLAGDQSWTRPGGIGTELAVYIRVSDTLPPVIANVATSPTGPVVTADIVTISGTATDAGQGDGGISAVTVNGAPADNGTASGRATANWSLDVALAPGMNTLTVVATDGSNALNQATDVTNITFQPIPDGDLDGMPDAWEIANGTNPLVDDAAADADLDDTTNGDEYKTGTDPQNSSSEPEGANGVNYVLFRDHFDDAMYGDRWYRRGPEPGPGYALAESGTELTSTVPVPTSACDTLSIDSLATASAAGAIYHAVFQSDAYGDTTLGLKGETDHDNRVEVIFENDATPYVLIRSVNNAVVTDIPINDFTTPLQGMPVDLRIAKNGDEFTVFVDRVNRGSVTNAGLGSLNLQPYMEATSCLADAGGAAPRADLIELLLDRDADGLADTHEDSDADGVVGIDESDPLNPDSDTDSVADGFDNCPVVSNLDQTDTDDDLLGDACDTDDDNDGVLDIHDQYPLDPGQSGIPGDIDGGGAVDVQDLLLLERALNGQVLLDTQQQYRADVFPVGNGDGALNVSDLIELKKFLLAQ